MCSALYLEHKKVNYYRLLVLNHILFQQLDTLLDPVGVDTDCPGGETGLGHVHGLQEVTPDWSGRLEAQPRHIGLGVIPGEGGQVNTGHCPQQPGSLTLLSQYEENKEIKRHSLPAIVASQFSWCRDLQHA